MQDVKVEALYVTKLLAVLYKSCTRSTTTNGPIKILSMVYQESEYLSSLAIRT